MKTMNTSQEMQVRRLVTLMRICDYILQNCLAEGGPARVVIFQETEDNILYDWVLSTLWGKLMG